MLLPRMNVINLCLCLPNDGNYEPSISLNKTNTVVIEMNYEELTKSNKIKFQPTS